LQHGYGEGESGWGAQGRAGMILDNLLAEGKTKPFIVVMENGGIQAGDAEALKEAGVNSRFYASPQTAHEWQTWRRSLREFAPLLFQD